MWVLITKSIDKEQKGWYDCIVSKDYKNTKRGEYMSYLELYKIISKPWASIEEIRKIANCGRDSAIKIRNNIENEINKSGKILPTGKTIVVPMKNVVDYLGLDLNYIIEMASTELNLLSNDRALNYASISR